MDELDHAHDVIVDDSTGNKPHRTTLTTLSTPPRYNLRTRKRQPPKRMSKVAAIRASKRLAAAKTEPPAPRTLPTTPDSDAVTELLETSEEEDDFHPNRPHPPKPEEFPSIMAFVLRDTCRKRYGSEWEAMYSDLNIRQALRTEVRNFLAEEIEHSTFVFAITPHSETQDSLPCQCYLHKYFGADKRLTFPNCHLQPHNNRWNTTRAEPLPQ